MHISKLKQSKFLTRAEVGKGTLLTIREITEENVAKEGAPEEFKYILYFDELEKGLVINSTNGQLIGSFLGEETNDWTGHKVVLYDDPSISFGGKLVGGIRVRQPRLQAATRTPPPQPAPAQVHRPQLFTRPAPPQPPMQPPPEYLPEADNQDDIPF